MTAALDTIIPILAAASIASAVFFVWRALGNRSRSSRAAYGVAQQEARQAMQVDIVRSVAAAFVGLILFGIIGLSPAPSEPEPAATFAPPTRRPATMTPTLLPLTPTPTSTVTSARETTIPQETVISATSPSSPAPPATATRPAATETATVLPTEPPRTEPLTATVSSGVGVWLRSIPSTDGDQLEWVLDGTVLVLLPGTATADELEWQQVRVPSGTEGWVAAAYIIYNE